MDPGKGAHGNRGLEGSGKFFKKDKSPNKAEENGPKKKVGGVPPSNMKGVDTKLAQTILDQVVE